MFKMNNKVQNQLKLKDDIDDNCVNRMNEKKMIEFKKKLEFILKTTIQPL